MSYYLSWDGDRRDDLDDRELANLNDAAQWVEEELGGEAGGRPLKEVFREVAASLTDDSPYATIDADYGLLHVTLIEADDE